MTITETEEAPEPLLESATFDARKRHRGAFRLFGGGIIGEKPRRRAKPRGRTILILAGVWVAFTVILAITANWLPIRNPNASTFGAVNQNPHWGREFFGYDAVGRSMVSRLIYGARMSYLIATITTAISLAIGCTIGLLSVYFRGTINLLSDLLCNVILSIPGLLFLLVIATVIKPSVPEIIGAISVLILPNFIRLTRATALSQIEREYVTAARGLGATPFRIIAFELLPNTLVALVTYCGFALPAVMLIEGSLSYLGFGVPTPTASWGQMIAQGQPDIQSAPWQALIPAILFMVTVFSVYTLGDWLRARVDLKGVDNL